MPRKCSTSIDCDQSGGYYCDQGTSYCEKCQKIICNRQNGLDRECCIHCPEYAHTQYGFNCSGITTQTSTTTKQSTTPMPRRIDKPNKRKEHTKRQKNNKKSSSTAYPTTTTTTTQTTLSVTTRFSSTKPTSTNIYEVTSHSTVNNSAVTVALSPLVLLSIVLVFLLLIIIVVFIPLLFCYMRNKYQDGANNSSEKQKLTKSCDATKFENITKPNIYNPAVKYNNEFNGDDKFSHMEKGNIHNDLSQSMDDDIVNEKLLAEKMNVNRDSLDVSNEIGSLKKSFIDSSSSDNI